MLYWRICIRAKVKLLPQNWLRNGLHRTDRSTDVYEAQFLGRIIIHNIFGRFTVNFKQS